MIQNKIKDSGVSPVIGIILMVAVTVILVALASNVVFDLGGDVGESPEIGLDANKSAGTVQVIRNGNVGSMKYSDGTNTVEKSTVGAGTTHDLTTGSLTDGTITAIAVIDGEEQVVRTFEDMTVA